MKSRLNRVGERKIFRPILSTRGAEQTTMQSTLVLLQKDTVIFQCPKEMEG